MTDHLHPAAIFELLDDETVHRHAANVLDVAARHGLTVGDDRQRLQRRTRVARWLLGMQPVEKLAHLGSALKAPAGGHRHQFHAALRPVELQIGEQTLDGIGAQCIVKQHAQFAHGHGLLRADQRGFKDPFGIQRIHGSAVPGKEQRHRIRQRLDKRENACGAHLPR